jgi:hypothetical protein
LEVLSSRVKSPRQQAEQNKKTGEGGFDHMSRQYEAKLSKLYKELLILFHERKNAQNVMVVMVTIMINCLTFVVLQTVAM